MTGRCCDGDRRSWRNAVKDEPENRFSSLGRSKDGSRDEERLGTSDIKEFRRGLRRSADIFCVSIAAGGFLFSRLGAFRFSSSCFFFDSRSAFSISLLFSFRSFCPWSDHAGERHISEDELIESCDIFLVVIRSGSGALASSVTTLADIFGCLATCSCLTGGGALVLWDAD